MLVSRAMPRQVGHALGGIAIGCLDAGRRKVDRPLVAAVLFAALGAIPDVDVLVEGTHRLYTHSLVAVALVGLTVALAGGASGQRLGLSTMRVACVCAAAYGSHVLLDWLGDDRSVPFGIRALWPLTDTYYQSDLRLFPPVERRYWLPGFWTANLRAIGWELAVLGPFAVLALWFQRRGRQA